MARLVIRSGNEVGRTLSVPAYPVVLGRGTSCDLAIDDGRVSRQHAAIRLHGEEWQIRDVGTPNGTVVNGARIADWTPLPHASVIRIGSTELVFEDPEAQADRAWSASAPARPTESSEPSSAVAAPPAGLPVIPGFDVERALGRGATGMVYRARQLSLNRPVAVKVLSAAYAASPDRVASFQREAQAMAAVSHPHVVQVFDVGHHAGTHFFTMELMEGGTVEEKLLASPESKLPWREAVRIASDAATGLAHLHERGLVHRDVKPGNLLLDGKGGVKLGDLGTLIRVDDAANARIGTPHFMSPEQAGRRQVTRASDVYSLGATLYRMLAGRTPFLGATKEEIMEHVAGGLPTPIRSLCPDIPAEVAAAVEHMMAKDPAERPADAAEVGARLAAALDEVRENRVVVRTQQRRRREASGCLTSSILALALLGAGAFVWRDEIRSFLRERYPAWFETSGGK